VNSVEILNIDCRELGADLLSTFDTMLVDPPYREHVHKAATSHSPGGGARHRDLGFEHLSEELREWIAGAAAQVKRWSIIYSDIESINDWRAACERKGAKYIRPIPWIRWSMPQLSGDRPTTGCEMLTCYWGSQKGAKGWNGPGNLIQYRHEEECPPLDVLEHKALRGDGKHKCEKPLDQMLDLVEFFSDPGDTVFDPNAGSGTTALACAILDRDFLGCELDPKWAEAGQARVNAFLAKGVDGLSKRDQERLGRYLDAKAKRDAAAA
jgi:site-specific DNA-methyltransferase (adenine-specific)